MPLTDSERIDALEARLEDVQTELRALAELTAADTRVDQVDRVLAEHAGRLAQVERHLP